MNFCMDDCSIELVVFWLDAEHFRHFDGNDDDIRLFAHHISKQTRQIVAMLYFYCVH